MKTKVENEKAIISWKILKKFIENSKSKKLTKEIRDELLKNVETNKKKKEFN